MSCLVSLIALTALFFLKDETEPVNLEVGGPSTSKVDAESGAREETPSSVAISAADTIVPDQEADGDTSLTFEEGEAPAA